MEGKDKPTKGPYAQSKFDPDFGSKITVLVVRMTEPNWLSVISMIMYSDFIYVPSGFQIKNR